jgi:hypothetical protein
VPRIDDGGTAFPQPAKHYDDGSSSVPPNNGMTLRDWFAGQALAGLVANINCAYKTQTFAKRALELADAMIAARKGGANANR